MKLGVIGGAGRLGATTAFCVGLRDCVDEIKLMDVKENFAAANVMDMSQAFLPVGIFEYRGRLYRRAWRRRDPAL